VFTELFVPSDSDVPRDDDRPRLSDVPRDVLFETLSDCERDVLRERLSDSEVPSLADFTSRMTSVSPINLLT
jgi:hypothetical protein